MSQLKTQIPERYAGIGSRKTPLEIQQEMTLCANYFRQRGWILRSGRAIGADRSFENGAGSQKEIFLPGEATAEAMKFAELYHGAWHMCDQFARDAHARNVHIILGKNLVTPVEFVLCWTIGGQIKGGTALGIKIALDMKIPVFNMGMVNGYTAFQKWFKDRYAPRT